MLHKIFKSITKEPIGVASIAQVYEAVTIKGEKVVLKIKKPGINSIIKDDITLMRELIKLYSLKGDPVLASKADRILLLKDGRVVKPEDPGN